MFEEARENEIRNPHHYTQGTVECIDALASMLTSEQFVAHCRATAVKYLWRAPLKGDEEGDLQKAKMYIEFALSRLSEEE